MTKRAYYWLHMATLLRTHNHPTRFWETSIYSDRTWIGDVAGESEEESTANAAYIVRACNNFPKLVEALRMLREITGEDWKDSFIGNESRGKLVVYLTYAQLESIHSAIAAAEGE